MIWRWIEALLDYLRRTQKARPLPGELRLELVHGND